jgi:hypothetical protein
MTLENPVERREVPIWRGMPAREMAVRRRAPYFNFLLKTVGPPGPVGSNPTPSAIRINDLKLQVLRIGRSTSCGATLAPQ